MQSRPQTSSRALIFDDWHYDCGRGVIPQWIPLGTLLFAVQHCVPRICLPLLISIERRAVGQMARGRKIMITSRECPIVYPGGVQLVISNDEITTLLTGANPYAPTEQNVDLVRSWQHGKGYGSMPHSYAARGSLRNVTWFHP